jgi:cell division protease FtsH
MDRIKIAYGGYIAEKLFYEETTTGTQSDLAHATDLARRMVTEWGMSALGPVAFGQEDQPIFLGKEIARHKDYSESKAQEIDAAIQAILDEAYRDAERILTEHKNEIEELTDALVEKETLIDGEVRALLGLPERKNILDLSISDESAPQAPEEESDDATDTPKEHDE